MTASSTPLPPTLTARTPEDVLALVPVVLGFVPRDSVAMLTVGSGPPFHARVDLPSEQDDLAEAVDQLLAPALQHRVEQALFVVYTDDGALAMRTFRALRAAFGGAGIGVGPALRADGERWWLVGEPGPGEPYDLTAHPFSAQAVLEGRVLHGSREELRATVAACPDQVAGVVAALAVPTDGPPDPAWISDLVDRGVARGVDRGAAPDDADVAVLLRGLLEPHLRDAAWCGLSQHTARDHVAFWTDVVRRTPDPLVPAPAALLALAAWQSGHGALAWCALDRCLDVDPDHPLGVLVARLLAEAVPPQVWDEVR